MSRPRLLFLVHGAERTGPPILLLRFAGWIRAHHDVEMSFVLLEGGPLLADFRRLGCVVIVDEHDPPRTVRRVESLVRRLRLGPLVPAVRGAHLRRRLRRLAGADLVYVNTAGSVRALRWLDPGAAPVVTQVHELSVGLDFWLDPGDRDRLIAESELVLVVSDAVGRELVQRHGADPSRIVRIPGFVADRPAPTSGDVAACRNRIGVGPDDVVVGSCGTVDWRKAPDLFLDLARRCLARRPARPPTFVWVGGHATSPLRAALEADLALSGLGAEVHFVDEVSDPLPWFAAFDLFVLPAREDAFPLVCLEAASLGVPVVCFDNGGMPEFVGDDAGAVVPYPDLDAMASVVVDLVDDPHRRRQLGAVAEARVDAHHRVDIVAEGLWNELEGILR